MTFHTIRLGQKIKVGDLTVTPVPAEHTVPAVGYHLDSGDASLVFSGDTTVNDRFWPVVKQDRQPAPPDHRMRLSNREEKLARLSKHLCPDMLATELLKLERDCEIHHPPQARSERTDHGRDRNLHRRLPARMLQNNQVLEF